MITDTVQTPSHIPRGPSAYLGTFRGYRVSEGLQEADFSGVRMKEEVTDLSVVQVWLRV